MRRILTWLCSKLGYTVIPQEKRMTEGEYILTTMTNLFLNCPIYIVDPHTGHGRRLISVGFSSQKESDPMKRKYFMYTDEEDVISVVQRGSWQSGDQFEDC